MEMLIENCTATIKDHGTSVVLMHDGTAKSTTLEALPEIIETINKEKKLSDETKAALKEAIAAFKQSFDATA